MMIFYTPQALDQDKPDDSMFKVNMNIPDVHLVSDTHLHHGGVTEQAPAWPALFENYGL